MFAGRTPIGVYDLKVALASQNLPTRYDLIVVYADASGFNFPLNLHAFDCPKMLVIGDTHHLRDPLRQVVEYAGDARFDFIVSMYNRSICIGSGRRRRWNAIDLRRLAVSVGSADADAGRYDAIVSCGPQGVMCAIGSAEQDPQGATPRPA
jgi:hypothetical protein